MNSSKNVRQLFEGIQYLDLPQKRTKETYSSNNVLNFQNNSNIKREALTKTEKSIKKSKLYQSKVSHKTHKTDYKINIFPCEDNNFNKNTNYFSHKNNSSSDDSNEIEYNLSNISKLNQSKFAHTPQNNSHNINNYLNDDDYYNNKLNYLVRKMSNIDFSDDMEYNLNHNLNDDNYYENFNNFIERDLKKVENAKKRIILTKRTKYLNKNLSTSDIKDRNKLSVSQNFKHSGKNLKSSLNLELSNEEYLGKNNEISNTENKFDKDLDLNTIKNIFPCHSDNISQNFNQLDKNMSQNPSVYNSKLSENNGVNLYQNKLSPSKEKTKNPRKFTHSNLTRKPLKNTSNFNENNSPINPAKKKQVNFNLISDINLNNYCEINPNLNSNKENNLDFFLKRKSISQDFQNIIQNQKRKYMIQDSINEDDDEGIRKSNVSVSKNNRKKNKGRVHFCEINENTIKENELNNNNYQISKFKPINSVQHKNKNDKMHCNKGETIFSQLKNNSKLANYKGEVLNKKKSDKKVCQKSVTSKRNKDIHGEEKHTNNGKSLKFKLNCPCSGDKNDIINKSKNEANQISNKRNKINMGLNSNAVNNAYNLKKINTINFNRSKSNLKVDNSKTNFINTHNNLNNIKNINNDNNNMNPINNNQEENKITVKDKKKLFGCIPICI